jgi:hypothetical protein
MELDFFQIKLREKGNKQWSRIVLADVHERRYSPVEKVKIQRENTWRIRYR